MVGDRSPDFTSGACAGEGDVVVVPDGDRDGFFVDVQSDAEAVFGGQRNVLEPFLFWG